MALGNARRKLRERHEDGVGGRGRCGWRRLTQSCSFPGPAEPLLPLGDSLGFYPWPCVGVATSSFRGSLGASAPLPLDLSKGPGAAPCLAALASLTLPSSGGRRVVGIRLRHSRSRSYKEGQQLNFFWRNLKFVAISPLPVWTSLLGWEPNNTQAGMENKCCSPDAQGILEQGLKSTCQGAKRLPEVMLSLGSRR